MLIAAALIAVYIVLGVLYESYVHPLTILSTLPSAGVGAVLALMLCNTEFSIIALIGVILLIGIVKEERDHDDRLRAGRRARAGAELARRDLQGCAGPALPADHDDDAGGDARCAAPLASGFGEGSELRRPLGISIVGGLLVSQALTLYTTPVIYLYLDRFRLWAMRRRSSGPHLAPGPVPEPGE